MKAIICGAGIAGLTLAWWLKRDGWQVLLVERASGPRDGGYMIDFVGSGYDVAELMGLLPQLRCIQTTSRQLCYAGPDGQDERCVAYDSLAEAFDGRAFTFMRGDLERVLRDALGDGLAAPVRYGTTIHAIRHVRDGVEVTLSDGQVERAELLVGADGIHSRVRELMFGAEQRFMRYLGYHTASYVFSDDKLRALVEERFLIVPAPGRQVGLYSTNDGQLAAWLVHRAVGPTLPDDRRARLQSTYGDLGDLVRQVLQHCPDDERLYYDEVAQVELHGWTRGRVTLVGDACQAVSLMAGQGASMALGGAYVLADELQRNRSIEAAAVRYEQRMRPFVRDKQKAGRRAARWQIPTAGWRVTARGLALSAARLPGMARLMLPAFDAFRSSVVPDQTRRAERAR